MRGKGLHDSTHTLMLCGDRLEHSACRLGKSCLICHWLQPQWRKIEAPWCVLVPWMRGGCMVLGRYPEQLGVGEHQCSQKTPHLLSALGPPQLPLTVLQRAVSWSLFPFCLESLWDPSVSKAIRTGFRV